MRDCTSVSLLHQDRQQRIQPKSCVPDITFTDLYTLCDVSSAEDDRFLRSTFSWIDSEDHVYYGQAPIRRLDLTEEHLKRYLRLIEDDLVYHRALPNLSVVVSPSEEDFFIKRPKLTFHGDSESAEILPRLMFEEAEILQKLSDIKHPNIVGFHGCTVRRGYITGLVLDRYPMTLSARLRKSAQTFDKTKCINDIRAGIEHLHSLEFAHNDLNPDNIVVDQKDKSVLIDIGSCRAFGAMLITAGTPGWVDDEDFVTSDRKHDDIAMQKLVAWLDEQC